MSIKRKLTWTMMGISVATVAVTVTAITAFLIFDMHQSKQEELRVTAAITADRNAASLMFLDNERAEKNLEIFTENPTILSACLYDQNGMLFAGYQAKTPGGAACPAFVQEIPEDVPGALMAQQAIVQNGDVSGHVFIAANTSEIENYVQKILLISGSATIVVLLGAAMATMYFQESISAPILKLASTVQEITNSRDFTLRTREDYTDETAILAHAFNEMLAEVRARDYELSKTNETLEQKVVERTHELEEMMHKAEQASAAKSEFLRNMSHEFRTPLHALVSFTSYGIKEYQTADREQLKKYFELMQNGAERLSRLVNEVLDLAKLEEGEDTFIMNEENVGDLARKSVDLVRPLMQDKKLKINVHRTNEMAVCDSDKITQVITNLLSNAVKFTPEGKSITLHIQEQDSSGQPEVAVSVIDEGIGIPEDEKDFIFDSFRQSSRTNTGAGGTGLGLAICRRIIDGHRGRIWAENNANGQGARVTFVIPANGEKGKRRVTKAAVA